MALLLPDRQYVMIFLSFCSESSSILFAISLYGISLATKILKENGFEVYNMIGGMKKLKEVYPNY